MWHIIHTHYSRLIKKSLVLQKIFYVLYKVNYQWPDWAVDIKLVDAWSVWHNCGTPQGHASSIQLPNSVGYQKRNPHVHGWRHILGLVLDLVTNYALCVFVCMHTDTCQLHNHSTLIHHVTSQYLTWIRVNIYKLFNWTSRLSWF